VEPDGTFIWSCTVYDTRASHRRGFDRRRQTVKSRSCAACE
jgi:hypothetical protein